MTTIQVRQSDIQALFESVKTTNLSYVTSSSDYKFFLFLKKYANNFTYSSTRIGTLGWSKTENFCAPYSNWICDYSQFQQEIKNTQVRVDNSNGSSNLILLDEFRYVYEDIYNPFLMQFHEGEVKNTEEHAQVDKSDLFELLKVAENARLAKYDKAGSLSLWFEFLVTYYKPTTVGYHHEIGLSETQIEQQIQQTLHLTDLTKFRKIYDDTTYRYACDCDCPKCDGFQLGYSFSDLYVSKDKAFAEFTLSKPEGQFYYCFCKYEN